MPGVRRGRVAPLVLVGVLLLPCAGVAHAASSCSVVAPDLGADLGRACRAVRAAVPSWDGRGLVRVGDGDPGVAAETLGSTVLVHAAGWASLTAVGRQVVLTHELVHVATDRFTTPRTPQWLVEGLADAIALRDNAWGDTALPDRVAAQELSAQVRRGVLPTSLPTDADFAASPAVAYQESWLAVDLLLRRFGDAAVLRLYRAAGQESFADALVAPAATPASDPGVVTLPAGRTGSLPAGWTGSGTNGLDPVRAPGSVGSPTPLPGSAAPGGRTSSGTDGLDPVRAPGSLGFSTPLPGSAVLADGRHAAPTSGGGPPSGGMSLARFVAAWRAELVRRLS